MNGYVVVVGDLLLPLSNMHANFYFLHFHFFCVPVRLSQISSVKVTKATTTELLIFTKPIPVDQVFQSREKA